MPPRALLWGSPWARSAHSIREQPLKDSSPKKSSWLLLSLFLLFRGFYVISHKIHGCGAVIDVCSKFQSRLTYNFQKADNHLETIRSKCQTLMRRLLDQSRRSPCRLRQRKDPGRVFHHVTPSASTSRSHISQTPTRKTAEMNEVAKRRLAT